MELVAEVMPGKDLTVIQYVRDARWVTLEVLASQNKVPEGQIVRLGIEMLQRVIMQLAMHLEHSS